MNAGNQFQAGSGRFRPITVKLSKRKEQMHKNMIQRRRLLAGAGIAAVFPGALCAESLTKAERWMPEDSEFWDVVVVGSGLAGLTAAASTLDAGAKNVIVFEKGPIVGGHSLYSSGAVAAVAPERSKDKEDTVERFVKEAMEVGGGKGDPEVLAKIGEKSALMLNWLEVLGVKWGEPFVAQPGKHVKSYAMAGKQAGQKYVNALTDYVRSCGARVLVSSPVTRIEPTSCHWLVEAQTPEGRKVVKTRAFVIACGGFTANVEARMKSNPKLTSDVRTTANPTGKVFDGATGEMIEMVGREGAQITKGFGVQAIPFFGGDKVYVHTTLDGLRINQDAEVLTPEGTAMTGLFAAGECTGGIFGTDRLGGAGLTSCFVMGREAGRQAAMRAKMLMESRRSCQ